MKMNEAVGAFEAAALMGVHWTRPKRLAEAGILSCRVIGGRGGKEIAIYSMRECEENWRDYEGLVRSGDFEGRPRSGESLRPAVLRAFGAKGRPQISYDDAAHIHEAAEILRVFRTRVPRLIAEGRLVARKLWSTRAGSAKAWIVSRKSAERLSKEIDAAEEAGKKRGRRRQPA